MYLQLIQLKLKALGRLLTEIGLIRILILLSLIIVLASGGIKRLFAISSQPYLITFYAIIIILIQTNRKDLTFLKINLRHPKKYLTIEYLIFSAPLILGILLLHLFNVALAIPVLTILIPNINFKVYTSFKIITPFAYKSLFWISTFRKYFLIFFILLFLLVISAINDNMQVSLFFIYCITFLISDFIIPIEPLFHLKQHILTPNRFLLYKAKETLTNHTILIIPYLIIFISFYSNHILTLILAYIISIIYVEMALLIKYAVYGRTDPVLYTITLAAIMVLNTVTIFIPLLIILNFLIIILAFQKASKNLTPYFT